MLWTYLEIGWKTCVFIQIDEYNQAISYIGEKLDNSIIYIENKNKNNNNKKIKMHKLCVGQQKLLVVFVNL